MKIPQNLKVILGSILPLIAVLILFAFAGRFGMEKTSETRTKIQTVKENIDALSAKLAILEGVDATQTQTNTALSALPSRNSSTVVVSQLKILAATQGVTLTNIRGSGEVKDPSGLSRIDVTFDAFGIRPQIMSFAASMNQIAPIALLDKIKINESGGGVRAAFQVKSFWSELPKTLPTLTDKVNSLTNSEKELLIEIAKLRQPLFVELPASETAGKAEPFN